MYYVGPVGTTKPVLYREVNILCPIFRESFKCHCSTVATIQLNTTCMKTTIKALSQLSYQLLNGNTIDTFLSNKTINFVYSTNVLTFDNVLNFKEVYFLTLNYSVNTINT